VIKNDQVCCQNQQTWKQLRLATFAPILFVLSTFTATKTPHGATSHLETSVKSTAKFQL